MKVIGASKTDYLSYGNRLLKEDITRLPSKETNKADFYTSQQSEPHHNQNLWRNIFTGITFALTGLYIAHRNNLFNPARREAKRIIKSSEMLQKTKEFVRTAIETESQREQTYQSAARKVLTALSQDTARGQEITSEAQNILDSNSSFNSLMESVKKRLSDVKDAMGKEDIEGLQNGYTVDVLDKLVIFIEKHLKELRSSGREYKNQAQDIIQMIFDKQENGITKAQETLSEIIEKRSYSTIDKFLRDSVLKRKFSA